MPLVSTLFWQMAQHRVKDSGKNVVSEKSQLRALSAEMGLLACTLGVGELAFPASWQSCAVPRGAQRPFSEDLVSMIGFEI